MDTIEGMTIREIAEIANVDERTVRRWVERAADKSPGSPGKMPSVADKMSAAGHGIPARFTLDEVIAIIRAGGRTMLADLLLDNARRHGAGLNLNPETLEVVSEYGGVQQLVKDGIRYNVMRRLQRNSRMTVETFDKMCDLLHYRNPAGKRLTIRQIAAITGVPSATVGRYTRYAKVFADHEIGTPKLLPLLTEGVRR